jgi:hypothetical protein
MQGKIPSKGGERLLNNQHRLSTKRYTSQSSSGLRRGLSLMFLVAFLMKFKFFPDIHNFTYIQVSN